MMKAEVKITTSKFRLAIIKVVIGCTALLHALRMITDAHTDRVTDWAAEFFVNGIKIKEV